MDLKNQIEGLKNISKSVFDDSSKKLNDLKSSLSKEDREKCDRWLSRLKDSIKNGTPTPPPLKF